MKRLMFTVVAIGVVFGSGVSFAQESQKTEPGAEMQKLVELKGGPWIIQSKTHQSPLGPAKTSRGRLDNRLILGGFALERTYKWYEENGDLEVEVRELVWYDAEKKKYSFCFLTSKGEFQHKTFDFNEGNAKWEMSQTKDNKQYHLRGSDTIKDNGSAFVRNIEFSEDGNTWKPLHTARFERPKKGTDRKNDEKRPDVNAVHTRVKNSSDEKVLLDLSDQWSKALLNQDTVTLDRIISDDYVFTNPKAVKTKKEIIDSIKSGDLVVTLCDYTDASIRVYGDVALIQGVGKESGQYKGDNYSGSNRFTDVFLKRDDQWQCITTHISNIDANEQAAMVKKTLEKLSGRWVWTGQQASIGAENSPYGQSGRFVGSGEARLIMDGQFILDEYQETSPEGHVLTGVSLISYDPIKKCFVSRDCLSDGSTCVAEFTIEGRVRKDRITIIDKGGVILLARVAGEYSPDWTRLKVTWEGSTDKGKTWQHWCKAVIEKSGSDVTQNSNTNLDVQRDLKPTTREDFEEFCRLCQGRWVCDITWAEDWPGIGKKGDTVTAYLQHTLSEDGNVLVSKFLGGQGSETGMWAYDAGDRMIKSTVVSSGGAVKSLKIRKSGGAWSFSEIGSEPDGTKVVSNSFLTFQDDGKTAIGVGGGTRGEKKFQFKNIWRKVSK